MYSIGISILIAFKVINFYMTMAFGILGLPISFIPVIKNSSQPILMSIFISAIELIIMSFVFGVMTNEMASMGEIPMDNLGALTSFAITFVFMCYFVSLDTQEYVKNFFHM